MQGVGPVVEVRLAVGTIIEEVLKRDKQNIPTPVQALAIIDTGATGTVVREDIVKQLNVNPVGLTLINTPSSANVQCYEYLMRICSPTTYLWRPW